MAGKSWVFRGSQKEAKAGHFKLGTPVRSRSFGRELVSSSKDLSRFLVILLITTNAFFVFLKQHDTTESKPLLKYPPASKITVDKGIYDVINDEYEKLGVKIKRRHATRGHGLQSFVLLNTYRTSPSTFAALGLGANALHGSREAGNCRWDGQDGKAVNGTTSIHYPGESHALRYEALIIICNLFWIPEADVGGTLVMEIDQTDSQVYWEQPGSETNDQENLFRHNITHCSPPIHEPLDAERLRQWMEFYRTVHAVDYFVFYDAGGIDNAVLEVLMTYIQKGLAEVSDVRGVQSYEAWSYGQVLLANDCVYRNKYTSKWALFTDFDEYLSFPTGLDDGSHRLLDYVLTNEDKPWISVGSLLYFINHCSQKEMPWVVERLVYHEHETQCHSEGTLRKRQVCMEGTGHRKYVLQPSEVHVVQTHRVMNPGKAGLETSTGEVRLNHFRGLINANQKFCKFVWQDGTGPPRLVQDTSLAELATSARTKHTPLQLKGTL